ncbi:MAG: tRNA-dihydrouridine synthase [Eubacterium sp.]|nr:tRNA-dihydrouridine synthase [Eubacterium sp.]
MNLLFAPLESITGFTYRNLHYRFFGGVDKYYAPFISPTHNPEMKGKEIRDILPENQEDGLNLIPQILSNKHEYFIKGAKQLIEMGYTDEININMGCPSGTVVSKNKGSGFLRDLEGMDEFFYNIFEWNDGLQKPLNLSVKTRIGVKEPEEFEKILEIYNKYKFSELIIHPRTRVQMYKETPNMDAFEYAYQNSENNLCYNGDINTVEDYKKIVDKYNIDSIMIGRGLIANPNLANEIRGAEKLSRDQIKQYQEELFKEFKKIMKSDKHLLNKMKEFWFYIAENFEDTHKARKLIRKTQNLYKYDLAVNEILENYALK